MFDVAFQTNAFQLDAFQTYTVIDASATLAGASFVSADAVRVVDVMAESNAFSTVTSAAERIALGASAILGASTVTADGQLILLSGSAIAADLQALDGPGMRSSAGLRESRGESGARD